MAQENVILAHVFGRRKRGEREEVRMLLFNPDGTEFVPGKERVGPAGPAGPAGPPGTSAPAPNPLDVVPSNLDMSSDYPISNIDCTNRTLVHIRKYTVPINTVLSKPITIHLSNLTVGTPYHITIQNDSPVPHGVIVTTNGFPVNPIVTAGQGGADRLHLPPGQKCSIMSLFTGPTDRPLAVVTRPGSPSLIRVTDNYKLNDDYDINPLVFVNSPNPVTLTLRD